jgi:menaquinol-cytochrome c reductase iron-sulfur subunit
MLKNRLTRREFLEWVTKTNVTIIAVLYAIPAIAYIIGDSLRRRVENWIPLGPVSKVELGTPTLFKARVTRTAGWVSSNDEFFIYVLTENGRDFIALSNICTHLGCRVRWIADREQFYCPCHVGIFDKEGNVISGPPPRPLDRYMVKVEREQISILIG